MNLLHRTFFEYGSTDVGSFRAKKLIHVGPQPLRVAITITAAGGYKQLVGVRRRRLECFATLVFRSS